MYDVKVPQSLFLGLLIVFAFCELSEIGVSGFTIEDLNRDLHYIQLCNRTSPVSLYTVNQVLINHKLFNIESKAFKCFLHCLYTKYGWMDEDGGFLLHNIKSTLFETGVGIDNLDYILYVCTALESTNRCVRSYLFTECFWDKMKEQNLDHDNFKSDAEQMFLGNE